VVGWTDGCVNVCMYFFNIYLPHAPLHPVILHACRELYVIYTVFTFLRICLLFMH